MNSGLHLYFVKKKRDDFPDLIVKIVVSAVLFMSILLTITSMFQLQYQVLITECVGIALVFAISLFWDKKHIIYGMILVITGFFVIGFLLGSKFAVDGLFILVNQGIDALGANTDCVFTKFAVATSQGNYDLFATFFMLIFSAVLAMLCGIAVNGKFKSVLLFLMIALVVPMIALGIVPGKWHSLFVAFGAFLAFGSISTDSEKWDIQLVGVAVLTIGLVISAALSLLIAPSNEVKPMFEGTLESIRYGRDTTNNYPMGQLEQLDTIEKADKTALIVTMDQPQPMYLKGYVGSTFDNLNWQDLPTKVHSDNAAMFYWMHEKGLHIQNQIAYVDGIYEEATGTDTPVSRVSIENVNGNRKNLYLPYEIVDLNGFHLKNNSDTTAEDAGLRGQKEYVFEVTAPMWKDTNLLGKKVFDLLQLQNEEAIAYENAESHYNAFVYANYTSLTEEQREVFERLLFYEPYTQGNHIGYEEAKAYIYQYLAATLTYDENASMNAEDEDFLRSLLMEEKKGSDIHFATVATLIYRYLGIPARYVEGYVITEEDVALMKPGESYEVKGTNIHAWVEVYYDTIGWVPVEFVSDYWEKMDFIDGESSSNATTQ